MAQYLLGIDAGLTVTKTVIFDSDGHQVAVASRRVATNSPRAYVVERDLEVVWEAVVATVRESVATAGIDPGDIAAIGVTAHGDGLYLVDAQARPVAPGIASLDTRGRDILARWEADGTADAVLQLSGQKPFASTPATLLAWYQENDLETLERAHAALCCKDAIRARITGVIATDRTEASLSFVNVHTQEYDDEILAAYGLARWRHLLPPVLDSMAIAGSVTHDAAEVLGLRAGTPVAAGAHDVDCSAIGSGAVKAGHFALIAGTYSINQAISTAPVIDERWCARNFVIPGYWMNMAVSPSSATNMEWFVRELAAPTTTEAAPDPHAFEFVEREVALIEDDPDEVVYLPFLFGSPLPDDASGTFLGLRGWHHRGHLLRAVMQGVAFNHAWHVEDLLEEFPATAVHLTGGATNSGRWCQMFADLLDREVRVALTPEAGSLGVCLLAGVAVGLFADLDDAVARAGGEQVIYRPNPTSARRIRAAYSRYRAAVEAMRPVWRALEQRP